MSLPLEVVLKVIEHARHDSKTLRSCCLLCRGCVSVSQRLLFNCARVTLPTVDRVLELQLLLEQKSALAAYITDLHVDASVAGALHSLRGRLPKLRSITAKDCHPRSMISWTTMEPEALAAFALSCASLQDLCLDGIQLERALFNAEPQAIDVPVRNLATAQTRAQLSPLRGLTKELAFPQLHTAYLALCSVLDSDEAAIGKLLRDCPSMRVLHVDLPESCTTNGTKLFTISSLWYAHSQVANLGIHANLTSLVLTLVANEDTVAVLIGIFRNLNFPSLKEVSLHVTRSSGQHSESSFHPFRGFQYRLNWGAREYILPSHVASHLTAVVLSFENLSAVHDVHRLLGLLGDIDRESVLTVAWNGIHLCPSAYCRDVLTKQAVKATLLQCTCSAH
jgi:hypothetical protein